MRKLTALLLSAILLLGLVGCGTQPAEISVPESSEVQTETPAATQTEAVISSSSAEETSSEILTTEADLTEESESEPSVPEDTAAEPSTAETAEVPPETTEEPTAEYIIADTFRFLLPADWEKQADGSLTAGGGSVRISFRTVPLNDAAFSEGIKIKDKDFGKQLVAYFNAAEDNGVFYTIYDSDAADQTARTESGLDYRFILVITNGDSDGKSSSILSAYSLDKENVLVIFFEYELSGGIAAEECLETVNRTIERIR